MDDLRLFIIEGSRKELEDRIERWYQNDIMVPLISYLCITTDQYEAYINGDAIFTEDSTEDL